MEKGGIHVSLSARLRSLRLEANLTQKQLATKLGMSKQAVSSWETGGSKPPQETQELLADMFGVSLDYLNGRSDLRELSDSGESEADLDAFLRRHDIWFDGKPLTYAEKLAVVQAIRLLRTAMEASEKSEDADHER